MEQRTSESPGQQHLIDLLDPPSRARVERVVNAVTRLAIVSVQEMTEPDPHSMGTYHEGIELQDALIELVWGTPQPVIHAPGDTTL